VGSLRVIPAERSTLPSAALGWLAGGSIAVDSGDEMGRTTVEPFFEVVADLDPSASGPFFHGASGVIRFPLPPEPLLPRGLRRLRQLLQQRYQL
jgi:putative peptide zinc metalloprotease protein